MHDSEKASGLTSQNRQHKAALISTFHRIANINVIYGVWLLFKSWAIFSSFKFNSVYFEVLRDLFLEISYQIREKI